MKTLLLTSACAGLLIGASGSAFAAEGSASSASQPGSIVQQAAVTPQGEHGSWPNRWAKGDESAATDALNQLEVHGYAQFSNFHKKGNDFEASVMSGGKSIQVLVDPAKGTVTQES